MTLVPADPARSIRSATGRRQNRVPHPCRGFWRQGGVFDFLDSRENPEVKIPTLSLQKPEGQGWAPLHLWTARNVISYTALAATLLNPVILTSAQAVGGTVRRPAAFPLWTGSHSFPPTASRHPQSYGPSSGFRRTQDDIKFCSSFAVGLTSNDRILSTLTSPAADGRIAARYHPSHVFRSLR